MYQRIIEEQILFPSYLSLTAISLLQSLLSKQPEKRLGATGGVREIKSHKFFEGIDWTRLAEKKINPPYELDRRISYFDTEFTSQPVKWSEDDTACSNDRSISAFELFSHNDTTNANFIKYANTPTCFPDVKSFVNKDSQNDAQKFDFRHIVASNPDYELFNGYIFSRDFKANCTFEINRKCSKNQKSMLKTAPMPLTCLKTQAIKPKSGQGDLQDPTVEEVESESIILAFQPNRRFPPLLKLTTCLEETKTAEFRSSSLHVDLKYKKYIGTTIESPQHKLSKQITFTEKNQIVRCQASKKLAHIETSKLISQKQTKKGENLIKLNDELNDVISERRRDIPVKKPKYEEVYFKEVNVCKSRSTERAQINLVPTSRKKPLFVQNYSNKINPLRKAKQDVFSFSSDSLENFEITYHPKNLNNANINAETLLSRQTKSMQRKYPHSSKQLKILKLISQKQNHQKKGTNLLLEHTSASANVKNIYLVNQIEAKNQP